MSKLIPSMLILFVFLQPTGALAVPEDAKVDIPTGPAGTYCYVNEHREVRCHEVGPLIA